MEYDYEIECRCRNLDPPRYDDAPVAFACDECGCEIYDGDTYYEINGARICEDCIDGAKSTAHYDAPESMEDI